MSKDKLRGGIDSLLQPTASPQKLEEEKPKKKNINFWLEESLHKSVKLRAIDLGMTTTEYLIMLIKRDLEEQQSNNK